MAHEENLSRALFLKGFDNQVLSKVGDIDTLDCIDALEPAGRFNQQINDSATAFHITRRRFDFNQ
jgi:hypothetical protein